MIHTEEEANSEQCVYKSTVCRNRLPTNTEQRKPSDLQASEAIASEGLAMIPSGSTTIVSIETVASTSTRPAVLSSRLVLAENLKSSVFNFKTSNA